MVPVWGPVPRLLDLERHIPPPAGLGRGVDVEEAVVQPPFQVHLVLGAYEHQGARLERAVDQLVVLHPPAGGVFERSVQASEHGLRVPFPHGVEEIPYQVGPGRGQDPRYLRGEDAPILQVRHIRPRQVLVVPEPVQVAHQDQHGHDRLLPARDRAVGHHRVRDDRGVYPEGRLRQPVEDAPIHRGQGRVHYRIAPNIGPVHPRDEPRVDVPDDAVRVEPRPVPRAGLVDPPPLAVLLEDELHVPLSETEQPSEPAGEDVLVVHAVHGGVAVEDHPRRHDHRESEGAVVVDVEDVLQHDLQELLHLVPFDRRFRDYHGVVAVVDEDYHPLAVVGVQHLAEVIGAEHQPRLVGLLGDYGFVDFLGVLVETIRRAEFGVAQEEFRHHVGEGFLERLVRPGPEAFERHQDDRVGVLLGVVRTDFGYLQSLETVGLAGVPDVEVRVEHAEAQCPSAAVRAGQEGDPGFASQEPVDVERPVHIVQVPVPQLPEIVASSRHLPHPSPSFPMTGIESFRTIVRAWSQIAMIAIY